MAQTLSTLKLPPFLQRILRKLHILPTPPPSPLQPGEAVWLYDNIAYRDPATRRWVGQFICAYFYRDTGEKVAKVVADIATKIGLVPGADDAVERTIANRVQPFLDTILEGRTVNVGFSDRGQVLRLGPGGKNGVSVNDIFVEGEWKEGDVVRSRALMPGTGSTEGFAACSLPTFETRFADEEGWAVVSGITLLLSISNC